jgi:thioredoxin 2
MKETLHLVCPHCGGVNRLPAVRLGDGARCGRCGERLFAGRPAEADDAAFSRQLERSDLPLLVDFWASWCGPCRMMAPAFEQAAAVLEPGVRLLKVNTETAQASAARFGIRSIPTLMLFRDGRELDRVAGAMDAQGIVAWTRRALG